MGGERGEITITLIAIVLAAILMLEIPLMAVANNQEDISQLQLTATAQKFVDNIAAKGSITQDDIDTFMQEVSKDGNTYDFEIEVQHLDENPGKKVTVTSGNLIGENTRVSEYKSAILANIEADSNHKYRLKKGDNIIIKVNNTNTTFAQLFRNVVYKITGSDTPQLEAIVSAMVQSNG